MSYPYVEYDGHIFSLIEPFTIDDKLITDIDIHIEPSSVGECEFSFLIVLNYTEHYGIRATQDINNCSLNRQLYDIYQYYEQTSRNHDIQLECRHMIGHYYRGDVLIQHLINDVREQCHCLRTRNGDRYVSIARSQRRILRTNGYGSYTAYTFDDVYDRMPYATYTSSFSDELTYRTGTYTTYCINPFSSYTTTCTQDNEKNKIIHTYSYKPQYNKHYMAGEDATTALLLGAEIEVDCGGESQAHAKEVLKIMNGEETWDSEENIFCVHDGSLNENNGGWGGSSGLEFPTQPGSLAWHKTLPYKKMFEYLDKNGYKAHDTKTCGLHIHINRSFFGDKETECIGKLMYILEKFNDEFSAIGRRSCHYSKMLGYSGEKCKDLFEKGNQNKSKYNAINLLHKETIEIRAFKGTLKYSTYMNTLEFVSNLAHFVKFHTEEEIENMKWSELYDTFSEELKQYYDERMEIENKKKQEEKEKNKAKLQESISSYRRSHDYPTYNFTSAGTMYATDRYGNILHCFSSIDLNSLTLSTSHEESREESANRTLFNMFISDDSEHMATITMPVTTSSMSANLSVLATPTESNKSDKKKELERLKKQLKTNQYYTAKKEINKKIKELQKEIKAEKKQAKKQKKST